MVVEVEVEEHLQLVLLRTTRCKVGGAGGGVSTSSITASSTPEEPVVAVVVEVVTVQDQWWKWIKWWWRTIRKCTSGSSICSRLIKAAVVAVALMTKFWRWKAGGSGVVVIRYQYQGS